MELTLEHKIIHQLLLQSNRGENLIKQMLPTIFLLIAACIDLYKSNGFRHPVFIDNGNEGNEIDRINKFPSTPEYQCFLLDKDNKVLLVGNPSLASGIWFLYKKIITERETKVLTMEKGGEFIDANEMTTLPPRFPLKRKEAAKVRN